MSIMDASSGQVPAAHGRARPPVARFWRVVAAVGVLVSAAVHLVLWVDGYRDIAVVGPLFLLNGVGGAVLAVLLVLWRHWLPLVGGIGFGAATLLAFVASTTVGFFGVTSAQAGPNEWIAAVSEVLAVVASTAALLREQSR